MNQPEESTKPPATAQPALPEAAKTGGMPIDTRFPSAHPPSFTQKMFSGIPWQGWVQLVVVCIAVGAVFEASGVNPFAPGLSAQGAFAAFASGALNVLGWVMQTGWRPLLTGAIAVLPLWLLWRVAVALFSKQREPQRRPEMRKMEDRSEAHRPQPQSKRWPDVV